MWLLKVNRQYSLQKCPTPGHVLYPSSFWANQSPDCSCTWQLSGVNMWHCVSVKQDTFRKLHAYSVGIPLKKVTKRHSAGGRWCPDGGGGHLLQVSKFLFNKVSLCPPLLLSKTSDVMCKHDLLPFIIHIVLVQTLFWNLNYNLNYDNHQFWLAQF